MMKIEMTVGCL